MNKPQKWKSCKTNLQYSKFYREKLNVCTHSYKPIHHSKMPMFVLTMNCIKSPHNRMSFKGAAILSTLHIALCLTVRIIQFGQDT